MIAAGRKSNTSGQDVAQPLGVDLLGAEQVEGQRDGVRGADGVRDLELAPVGEPGGDDVLRDVARHVGGGPVDLRGVLAAEGAAAVRRVAAVGVHDDLAAGEAGVGLRAADLEAARGVHQDAHVRGVELGELAQHGVDDLGLDVGLQQRLDVDLFAVLGADQHGVDAHGLAVLVLDRDLGLAVGPQIRHDARLADVGQSPGQPVGHGDGHRHELVGVAAGEAEHHALVAGAELVEVVVGVALTMLEGVVHAARDVGRLLLDGGHHAAGLAVEPELRVRVADVDDRAAHDARDVHPRLGGDLADDEGEAGRDERLARDAAVAGPRRAARPGWRPRSGRRACRGALR